MDEHVSEYAVDAYGEIDKILRAEYTLEEFLRKSIRECLAHIKRRVGEDGLDSSHLAFSFEFWHHHRWDFSIHVIGRART